MEHLQSPARARQGEVEASNPNLDAPPFLDRRNEPTAARGWRDHIKVHRAADLFPMMSEAELRELGEDIKKHGGLISPITFVPVGDGFELLDGRNRLDAMELVGMSIDWKGWAVEGGEIIRHIPDGIDPYDFVLTAKIQRRHLTDEQRRQLIAKIIKAKPAASDRAIAKQVKRDHKTVAKIRKKLEATGEVSPVEKRTGADGKARKSPAKKKPKSKPGPATVMESVEQTPARVTGSAEISAEAWRAKIAALDTDPEPLDDDGLTPRPGSSAYCRDKFIDACEQYLCRVTDESDRVLVTRAWTRTVKTWVRKAKVSS